MLVIRDEQRVVFSADVERRFFERAVVYLSGKYPDQPAESLRSMLHRIRDWAKGYALHTEAGIVTLAELEFHYGRDLYSDPSWKTILQDPRAGSEEKVKRLREYLPDTLAADSGGGIDA